MRAPLLLCMLLLVAAGSPAQAAEGRPGISVGLDYSSGDYGSSTTTRIWAFPLSLKYRTDDWTLRLSTAWQRVEGDGSVTPDGDPINPPGTTTPSITHGWGDITTSATYNLVDERGAWVGIDVGAKIKFGTASTEKFLGTGENDYTVTAEIFQSLGSWMPFLDLGHKWKGDPDTIDYRNVWLGSLGADYRLTPHLSLGGSYDWQQAVTATSDPVSEAFFYLNFRLNADSRLNLYAVGGFSDASPDWGSGLTFSHRF